jgi:hypothetical protein
MKEIKFKLGRLSVVLMVGILFAGQWAQAQSVKPRISTDYFRVMNVERYLTATVKYKGDDGIGPAMNLSLNIYAEVAEDSLLMVGTATTDMAGTAKYVIPEAAVNAGTPDSVYQYYFKVEDRDGFKDASKGVKFTDASVEATVLDIDSIQTVQAKVSDSQGEPLEDEKVTVQVERLFAPLTVGESSYKTDEDGIILVPMEEPLPGVDGNLKFIITMEGRKYGTVIHKFEAPIGVPVVDLSTFDQRTMWSPPSKTPWFLLIFPNLIILGIWAVIALLVFNLYRISKL